MRNVNKEIDSYDYDFVENEDGFVLIVDTLYINPKDSKYWIKSWREKGAKKERKKELFIIVSVASSHTAILLTYLVSPIYVLCRII